MPGSLLGEKILPRHWLGLALGFAGVVIVLSPKFGAIGGGVTLATLAAALIAVAGMSLGTIWQKRFGGGTDPVTSALCQYLGARGRSWRPARSPSRRARSSSTAS